jgi:serine/threonine-protein kinase RsbW
MAQIELQLTLPRDARFVAILRKVTSSLLRGLEVPDESVDDVTVALSEACGNVIQHARGTDEYGVRLSVEADHCSIEVRDLGPGFDPSALAEDAAPLEEVAEAEDGRGIPLLQALMDDLEFVRDDDTTTVRLVKRWDVVALGRVVS